MFNRALIFIKPQAVRPRAVEFIKKFLVQRGIRFANSGTILSEEIENRNIIDRHYFAISRSATVVPGSEYPFSPEEEAAFQTGYGKSLAQIRDAGQLLNATEGSVRLGNISSGELNRLWRAGKEVKLGSGLYVSRIDKPEIYILNGFYPSMKELFTAPGLEVVWFDSIFDPGILSWYDFRHKVIGATDPEKAAPQSLRRRLLEDYRSLGLDEAPSTSKNGVHASAGPIEGLRERMVWLGEESAEDPLGQALAEKGIGAKELNRILGNGSLHFNGKTGPAFDRTEDTDARDVVPGIGAHFQ